MSIRFTGKPAPYKTVEQTMRELGYGHLYKDKPAPKPPPTPPQDQADDKVDRSERPTPFTDRLRESLKEAAMAMGGAAMTLAIAYGVWAFGYYVSWIPVAIVGGGIAGGVFVMVMLAVGLHRIWP